MTLRLPTGDRERLIVASAVAVAIHAVVFALVSFLNVPDVDPLEPPMYVSLEPVALPVEAGPPEEEPPVEPEEPTPPDESVPDPPVTEELAAAQGGEAAPSTPPARTEPTPSAAVDPAPTPEPAATPAPAREVTQFVPTPPPPSLPRQRAFSDVRGDFASAQPSEDSAFIESQISSLYQWQDQYRDQLSAWESRQDERAVDGENADNATSSDAQNASDDTLEAQLRSVIEQIRSSSRNVVDAGIVGDRPRDTASSDPESAGDGSGIAIGEGEGTRARVSGAPVDLSGVSLATGFPPEYPVRVTFQVDSSGRVSSPTLAPPSPDPDLNAAIREAVRSWRFEAAEGAGTVSGSVTIIVQTR